jgi:hypothetical protein
MPTFQEVILRLQDFWDKQGCALLQPYDIEVGAGTFHTATFLRAIGPEPWNAAYVQPSRRPKDGRYGENPNRLQHYYQYQVVLKPSPANIQDLYLDSLRALGIDTSQHDIRFVEDDWESPTLGAWGLGWEVWLDGMEVTQFTYFQEVGSLPCKPVLGEITYGIERLAMYLQGVENVFDLVWAEGAGLSGDLRRRLSPERSRAVEVQLRALQRRDAVPPFRRTRIGSPAPDRCRPRAARLRDGHEVLAHLQPARRARRHFGHRACGLHRPRACAGTRSRAGLPRFPPGARLPDVPASRRRRGEMP